MRKEETFLPKRLLRNFSVVGLWTLLSRILGFIRDILVASFLGSGPVAEAFIIAFTLPNMFRRLFAEGAINTAFIPILSKKLSSKRNAENFSSDALSLLTIILLTLTSIAEIFMPSFVFMLASGFSEDSRLGLSINFGRVMFPYIFLISISALLGGVLNTLNKYSVAAAAPLLLNIFFIFGLLIAYIFKWNFGWTLSFCVPIAGLAQLLIIVFFLNKHGFKITLKIPRFTPEMRRFIKIAIPAALAGGVIQINLVVGRQVASYFDGAIAWLNYADRVFQLPLGVVGIAIGVVLLPDLSNASLNKPIDEKNNIINRSTEFALFLTLPATCALLIIPYQIITVLFERGAFTSLDAINTSNALFVYAIGLPAFVFQKIFSTIYFSNGDTRSPFNFAVIGMLTNLVLAVSLSKNLGYLAPPVGTTISGWLIALLLWKNANIFKFKFDEKFKLVFKKLIVASFSFSIFLILYTSGFEKVVTHHLGKTINFIILILVTSGFYFGVCYMLGLQKLLLKLNPRKESKN